MFVVARCHVRIPGCITFVEYSENALVLPRWRYGCPKFSHTSQRGV
jgi:hypothetical protein